jgi:arsenite-transporting ATPase
MNPEQVVIQEAMRTFTYLNLYGYLTDAVLVNRIFPEQTAGSYFEGWQQRQREQLDRITEAFAPVPVLQAPYFEREVREGVMLDRLADALFGDTIDPAAIMHSSIVHELAMNDDSASLTIDLPLATKDEISLKMVGQELVVAVAEKRRTFMLPPAFADYQPDGASFNDGKLEIAFVNDQHQRSRPAPGVASASA